MAAENISLNITGNALQQLQKIETQVGKVAGKFSALKNAIAGIAVSGLIANTLKFADSIQDLSNATGVATANILGFGKAVQQNGGDIEGANNAINKFVLSINEAAEGGEKSQLAFQKVGVTLQDLRTLSEQDLFNKAIQGLSQIQDKAKAAAIANELFGKSLRGVDFAKLSSDYSKSTIASERYTEAIRKGAETQQEIETAINNLKLSLLEVLQPIGQLAKAINQNAESISKWIQVIFEVVKVLAGLFILGRIISLVGRGYNAVKGFVSEWKRLKLALKEVTTQTPLTNKGILKATQGVERFIKQNPELAKFRDQFIRIRDGIRAGTVATIGFIGSILGLTAAYKKYKELTQEEDFTKPLVIQGEGAMPIPEGYFENRRKEIRQVEEANKKLNDSIAEVRKTYEKNRDLAEQAAAAEVAYAMMATDTAEQIKAQRDAYNDIVAAIDELKKKRETLTSDQAQQKTLIDQEIAALMSLIPAATESARVRVELLQEVKNAQDEVIKQTELMKQQLTDDAAIKALRDQIALIQLYGDELENANIALEVSQSLEQALLSLRQQELDLIAKKGQLTQEQFDREMAQIEALRQAAYKRAGDEIDAKTDVQQAQRIADEDATLSIKKYLDELEKGVTPAKQSLESVQSVFGNMNNALETFVRSGKFKFKDFALSVIQDLLLIQAKAAMTKIFSAIIGGIFPGLAEGGPAKKGQPYIVGEKGPELFVPNTGGTVVPNNAMNKGMSTGAVNAPIQNTYITNNINAVDAKSVAQLFAENRKTLLGTVRMAEKEMPYMGRT